MKILKLRFKNLNSLAGEWLIDFTAPEYQADGIFAITGPTGAGKSTILDAICLALYGATPRLGKITKSGNEIMSRQTGECFAEVTFAAASGSFRCYWYQHRARKRPDGNLLEARHEIADAVSGKILESKKREVAAVIERKTGMNFERFTRSILLAQGEFDTFLKADSDKRAPILEQITGSEIYSEISRRVHERQRAEQEKLKLLQAETDGITILSEAQESEIKQELTEKERAAAALTRQLRETEKAISWQQEIERLGRELTALAQEEKELQTAIKGFQPERERLSRARKAAELEGEYAVLTSTRKQQESDRQAREKEELRLPEITRKVSEQKERFKELEQQTIRARAELSLQTPLIQKVRTLDQQLADKKSILTQEEAEIRKISNQIADDIKSDQQLQNQTKQLQQNISRIWDDLEKHTGDELLLTEFAGIKEQLKQLLILQQDISTLTTSRRQAEKQLEKTTATLTARHDQAITADRKLEEIKQQIRDKTTGLSQLLGDRRLREYRADKEARLRELALKREIADLKTLRKELKEGRPCPLCGSCEHPFARGQVPETVAEEKEIGTLSILIERAEKFEAEIKKLETGEKEIAAATADSTRLEAEAANEKSKAEDDLKRINADLNRGQTRYRQFKKALLERLQPLEITNIDDSDLSGLADLLQTRLNLRQELQAKKVKLEKELDELNGDHKKIRAVIATQEHSLSELQQKINLRKDEFQTLACERKTLFGDKQPDTEQKHLEKAAAIATEAEKSLSQTYMTAKECQQAAKVRITSLSEQIKIRARELQDLEAGFSRVLAGAGFSDEELFTARRLAAAERTRLTNRAEQLDALQTRLKARTEDRQKRLTAELEKKITDTPTAELDARQLQLTKDLKLSSEELAGLKHKLSENQKALDKIKEKQALITAQAKECHRWDNLHLLIGSADGKKFRNFAQGLTFEMMVLNANRQLDKMTDRYLLVRDNKQPLELNVVDKYQAGEIRSTKNLSGGESFIVSLALALGLSKMASRKVRVDSLFLDEGFGTLDETALETALETLATLQQSNKLIGIISHVPALKERIATRINVLPTGSGKSAITGPGCRKHT